MLLIGVVMQSGRYLAAPLLAVLAERDLRTRENVKLRRDSEAPVAGD